jgi:hypothetical protein
MSKQYDASGECPMCYDPESVEYTGDKIDDDTSIGYKWVCHKCECSGIEWHSLQFACNEVTFTPTKKKKK